METLEASLILEKIISKGGMMGKCAQLYKNDSALIDKFIRECSEQCHNAMVIDYWGEGLVAEIKTYAEKTAPK